MFLNAQNKQTIYRITQALRRLGIPAVALVDLDAIEKGGTEWTALLKACQIPPAQIKQFRDERTYLASVFDEMPLTPQNERPLKKFGINVLNSVDKIRAEKFLEDLALYGLFLVPTGEAECWLKNLGATGHGSEWVTSIFPKMGDSMADPNYLKPAENDVWEFINKIAIWIDNPNRLGID